MYAIKNHLGDQALKDKVECEEKNLTVLQTCITEVGGGKGTSLRDVCTIQAKGTVHKHSILVDEVVSHADIS